MVSTSNMRRWASAMEHKCIAGTFHRLMRYQSHWFHQQNHVYSILYVKWFHSFLSMSYQALHSVSQSCPKSPDHRTWTSSRVSSATSSHSPFIIYSIQASTMSNSWPAQSPLARYSPPEMPVELSDDQQIRIRTKWSRVIPHCNLSSNTYWLVVKFLSTRFLRLTDSSMAARVAASSSS